MATKKAASTAKKVSPAKKTTTAKKPTASTSKRTTTKTKVTTVKAVESRSAKTASVPSLKAFSFTSTPLVAAMIAEFIGAFLIAALFVTQGGQPIGMLFSIIAIVLATGAISGGYANPALVAGAWVTKRIDSARAIGYFVAQVLGAMLALVVLGAFIKAATPEVPAEDAFMAAQVPRLFEAAVLPEAHYWMVLLAEVIGALILGFVAASAFGAAATDRVANAIKLGFGYFIALAIAGSIAAWLGAHTILNPAAAIAAQAINFETVWPIAIYFVGTIAGAIGGFALYDYLKKSVK